MNLHKIDRRWIFILMIVGVALPLIFPIGLPIEEARHVRMVYDLIESLPAGERILISFDYDPGARPELQPAAIAIINHAFRNNLRIVTTALWAPGATLAEEVLSELPEELIHGEDFINLGFVVGGMVAVRSMGRNIREVFPTDSGGVSIYYTSVSEDGLETRVNRFPIMDGVRNLDDFAAIVTLSAGTPGINDWIMIAGDEFGRPITGAVTAVSTPAILPFVNDIPQLHGVIGGMMAAAVYEKLIDLPGTATAGMDAQSVAHLIIIIFIIIGNVSWHIANKKKKVV